MAKKKESSKYWKCDRCGELYKSPIRISAVLCQTCTKKTRGQEKWMTPLDNS
jgi:formylmethanofuran dehydrogenase subunit E